jgi:hypothetical protein
MAGRLALADDRRHEKSNYITARSTNWTTSRRTDRGLPSTDRAPRDAADAAPGTRAMP